MIPEITEADMQYVIRRPLMGIIPPHMLKEIAKKGTASQKERALKSLMVSEKIRGRREAFGQFYVATSAGAKSIKVYDTKNTEDLPGSPVSNPSKSKDVAVKEAYKGASTTYDLFKSLYDRNSIDDKGMCIESTVHYGKDYNNAFEKD